MCEQTKDVFYFGESVDYYKNGKVVNHEGSWLAGEGGNRPGLIMPGQPKVGMRYYQEIAPGVAMDRAEIVSLSETCTTPAGTFPKCMKVQEGSAIELLAKEFKFHAPGIGLVQDEDVKLVKHGFIKTVASRAVQRRGRRCPEPARYHSPFTDRGSTLSVSQRTDIGATAGLTHGGAGCRLRRHRDQSAIRVQGSVLGNPRPAAHSHDNVHAVLSMMFWAVTIIVSLKDVTFMLRFDNRGEGGVLVPAHLRAADPRWRDRAMPRRWSS